MSNEVKTRPGQLTKINSQVDYLLLDSSGSMMSQWFETLSSLDAYVQGVKDANINSQVILHTFDSGALDAIQLNQPIAEWIPFSNYDFAVTWGTTPLYDAINLVGRNLRDLDPPRASIVIVTDGGENASRHTNLTQAKAILDWMRAKGWQVTFIGANFDNSEEAGLLGVNPASAIGVERRHLTDATKALAEKRKRYGLYGEDMHYTESERQQFGGYLAAPKS